MTSKRDVIEAARAVADEHRKGWTKHPDCYEGYIIDPPVPSHDLTVKLDAYDAERAERKQFRNLCKADRREQKRGMVESMRAAMEKQLAARKLHPHGGNTMEPHKHPGSIFTHAHPGIWAGKKKRKEKELSYTWGSYSDGPRPDAGTLLAERDELRRMLKTITEATSWENFAETRFYSRELLERIQ